MSIRILGGSLKGMSLKVGPASMMRPTSVMLRRKAFDSLQCLEGYDFWDLCAGSGSMGIEALSRGANKCYFFEKQPKNFGILKDNLRGCFERFPELEAKTSAFKRSFLGFEKLLEEEKRNIIFFDPPYADKSLYESFFEALPQLSVEQVWVEMEKSLFLEYQSKIEGFDHKIYHQSDKFICKLYLK